MDNIHPMRSCPVPSSNTMTKLEKALILVVDDCRVTQRLLSMYLQEAGYQVGIAGNGLDALEMLGRESYALVITDLNMPRMDGVELTRIIRNDPAFGNIPVMILTTHGEDHEKTLGMEAGASVFLTKPISQLALIHEVNAYISHADQPVDTVSEDSMIIEGREGTPC